MTVELTVPDEAAAAAAERRFLDDLRLRVAWQAEQAARQRAEVRGSEPVDPLDLQQLAELVRRHPEAPRHAEWRAFLAELRFLADDRGRLPGSLERLVRVVLAELLER